MRSALASLIRNPLPRSFQFLSSHVFYSKRPDQTCATVQYRSLTSSRTGKGDTNEHPSMWDTPDLKRIFDGNRKWQREMLARDPTFFERAAKGQSPEFLLIGCSDSRVGAQEIMGMSQGELFIHRNIANCVVHNDMNLLSVIFYAVNVLKVHDIIVLGHYECGGVRAASSNQDLGLIEHWLRNIRDVQRLHKDELDNISDPETKHRRLVELNVQEQCFNLFGNSIVQQMQAKTGRPRIHGFVYDISNGLLKHLDIDFKSQLKKYRNIYAVADFRRYEPINIDKVVPSSQRQDDAGMSELRTRKARLLFEAMDVNRRGSISKKELKETMGRFGLQPTEDELEEMMAPLAKMDRESIDLADFEKLLVSVQEVGTDRLVVIRRKGMGNEAPRPLRCRASTSVLELKQAIEALEGIPVEQQTLLYDGVRLVRNDALLAEIGISDVAEIDLMIEIIPEPFKKS